jgi:hypothetical protein
VQIGYPADLSMSMPNTRFRRCAQVIPWMACMPVFQEQKCGRRCPAFHRRFLLSLLDDFGFGALSPFRRCHRGAVSTDDPVGYGIYPRNPARCNGHRDGSVDPELVQPPVRQQRAAIVFFVHGSMILGELPTRPQVSFESHLIGALVGTVVAIALPNLGPCPREKKYWEDEGDPEEEGEPCDNPEHG